MLDLKNDKYELLYDKKISREYAVKLERLKEGERYAMMLIEKDIELSKELGEGDEIMEEYVREAEEVSNDEFFGEAYDKEWNRYRNNF